MIEPYAKALIAIAFGLFVAFLGGSSAEGVFVSVVYTAAAYFVLGAIFRRDRPRAFLLKCTIGSGLCLGVLYLVCPPMLQSDQATVLNKYAAVAMMTLASVLHGPHLWFSTTQLTATAILCTVPYILLYVSATFFCLAVFTGILLPAFYRDVTHES